MNAEKFIEKLANEENVSIDEMKDVLIAEAIINRQIIRSGGAVFTLPNPQIYVMDYEAAEEMIAALSEARRKIRRVQSEVGNYSVPLSDMISFLNHRIFYDKDETRNQFRKAINEDYELVND